MHFIGYARVSDKEQVKKGYSIEAQQEAIEQWASEQGHAIGRVMVEPGRSGSKPSQETRPVFEQAVKLILIGAADGLVVRWMDRFARNVEDFLRVRSQFFQAGKQLISISEPLLNGDPSDPVARYISVAIMNAYQLQAELSGLKAAQGRERRARQGQYPGLPPVGYIRVEKRIVIDQAQGPMIAASFGDFSTGRFTLESWVIEAKKRGYRSNRGEIIQKGGWHRILRNSFYVGRYTWKEIEYLGDYEPLVSETTFEAVQAVLDAHGPGDLQQRHFWLLAGLLWSDVHHKLMVGATIKGEFRYYRAIGAGSEHNVRADDIEGQVITLLSQIRYTGENKYHLPEHWRLGFQVAGTMSQLWPCFSEREKQDFLRLIFFRKGIRVSAGGAISRIDLLPGFVKLGS